MLELPKKAWLRPDELAEYLSVTRKTIYQWISSGQLEAVKIGGVVRIHRDIVSKLGVPIGLD